MTQIIKKKSPRAPSIPLGDAVEKACKIYEMERCHAAPADGVAQHIGYKNAGNGTALSTIASLKYYGLLDRPKEGMLAVSRDVEAFRFAPAEAIKQAMVIKWLRSPPLFAELLDKYAKGLPSGATLKFELIQKGFSPLAADVCLQAFQRSVDYAHYFEQSEPEQAEREVDSDAANEDENVEEEFAFEPADQSVLGNMPSQPIAKVGANHDVDRIPVRLAGGRRAWIEIPMPFYKADKERLKKQIDFLLANDEGEDDI